jgi:hypothetical protein
VQLNCLVDSCSHGVQHQDVVLGENFQSVSLVDLDGTTAFEIDLVESCFLVDGCEFNYFLLCLGFLHRYIYSSRMFNYMGCS